VDEHEIIETSESDVQRELSMWRRWREEGDMSARDALIERYTGFVRIMALKLYRRRFSDEFEFADYLQFATIGMLEAFQHYDPAKGAGFQTYSGHRIRGAVLDGLTTMSERQQQITTRSRLLQERSESLAAGKLSRSSAIADLAEIAIGLALGYMLEGSSMYQAEDEAAPENAYQRVELLQLRGQVRSLIEQLPASEKFVVKAHYINHLAFVEIARTLGVSKARVSQLHQQALGHLREAVATVAPWDMAW